MDDILELSATPSSRRRLRVQSVRPCRLQSLAQPAKERKTSSQARFPSDPLDYYKLISFAMCGLASIANGFGALRVWSLSNSVASPVHAPLFDLISARLASSGTRGSLDATMLQFLPLCLTAGIEIQPAGLFKHGKDDLEIASAAATSLHKSIAQHPSALLEFRVPDLPGYLPLSLQ